MLTMKSIIFGIGMCLFVARGHSAGLVPAVNQDMGCTTAGQMLLYNGSSIVCAPPQLPVTTVSSLPTCNSAAKGVQYFVTDALTPVALANVTGGGAVQINVVCNGTAWVVG